MQSDVWYELILRELSDEDLLNERIREAESVQLPAVEPGPTPEAGKPTS